MADATEKRGRHYAADYWQKFAKRIDETVPAEHRYNFYHFFGEKCREARDKVKQQ